MNFSPSTVASARTARLVREATTPVYTTTTPVREHMYVVELEADTGYRQWVPEAEAEELMALGYYSWSDHDHSAKCWCFK